MLVFGGGTLPETTSRFPQGVHPFPHPPGAFQLDLRCIGAWSLGLDQPVIKVMSIFAVYGLNFKRD